MNEQSQMLEFEPGCAGAAHLLEVALLEVMNQERFRKMSVAEMIGVLELVKCELLDSLSE